MELQMPFGLMCLTMQVMTRPSLYLCHRGPSEPYIRPGTAGNRSVPLYMYLSYRYPVFKIKDS